MNKEQFKTILLFVYNNPQEYRGGQKANEDISLLRHTFSFPIGYKMDHSTISYTIEIYVEHATNTIVSAYPI
jgi:hypothetical protein